ncbi:hypothetical protein LNAOJCKE_3429 [Methylorubrum aminovorans]|jgi:hypothetical protein|uniref:Uncharacterized protein n=1 Tax=Methylorubrum aminovorans TaxID=269069 RepID=A0ABQ4UGI3_9HYPH|nr:MULTISPECIES: hypothetical protein [Methylorubrum]GJE66212.1 hypothetical protein LNAOJCKE_3429 [Methylorubrum aminovorans]
MTARPSILDIATAWQAADEANRKGRGALGRTAASRGVSSAVVKEAIDRVEAALKSPPFFVIRVRRSGDLSQAGLAFLRTAPAVLKAWQAMEAAVTAETHVDQRDGR